MIKFLDLTLYVVLLYNALIMLALPSDITYLSGSDGSTARFIVYLGTSLIFLTGLCLHGFKKLSLPVIAMLIGWIIFSSQHCPNIHFDSLFAPKDSGLFNFKPMFECLLFFGMFMALYSWPLTIQIQDRLFKSLWVIGIITSVYLMFQHFGVDQFFRLTDTYSTIHASRHPESGSIILQPVYASAMLVMLMPFMYKKHWILAVLASMAVLMTGNRSGMVGIATIWVYFLTDSKRVVLLAWAAYIAVVAIVVGLYMAGWTHLDKIFYSDGRLTTWPMIMKDFFYPAFPGIDKSFIVTGQGIGAFSTVFPFYNQSAFYQAHNEYLELWRGCSFIGLGFMLYAMAGIIKSIKNKYIFISLIGIFSFAFFNPVWHIPQLQFLTVFLIGIGLNLSACLKMEDHYEVR